MEKEKPKSKEKKNKIMEDKITIYDQKGFFKTKPKGTYYMMYFRDKNTFEFETFAIFKGNHSSHKKIELPIIVFNIKEIHSSNYKIAERLQGFHILFKDDENFLDLDFSNVDLKNKMGEEIRKLTKERTDDKKDHLNEYEKVELKYKIIKIVEKEYFDNFKDCYDYRSYLEFEYLKRFADIYKKKDLYKYLKNRFFMGKMFIINKKGWLIS